MSRVELRKLWESRIREFRASGQSATSWCEEREFNIHQFRYWLRRFPSGQTSPPAPVRWLSVDVHDTSSPAKKMPQGVTVCIGEWRIEVPDDFSPVVLQRVVRALSELC